MALTSGKDRRLRAEGAGMEVRQQARGWVESNRQREEKRNEEDRGLNPI